MRIRVVVLVFLVMGLLYSCKPEVLPDDHSDDPLIFTKLISNRDTIFTEDTTQIKAYAVGYQLSYHWAVDKGDLLGAGAIITFVATPCTIGDNKVYCTVKDGNGNEETKYVLVTVL